MFGIAKGQLTIFWSTKWESMSQSPENIAWGSPQPLGSGLRVVISAGIAFRGKKYTDIAVLVHSVAYTPPPTALKPLPESLGSSGIQSNNLRSSLVLERSHRSSRSSARLGKGYRS
jgi:hypothetical protein